MWYNTEEKLQTSEKKKVTKSDKLVKKLTKSEKKWKKKVTN